MLEVRDCLDFAPLFIQSRGDTREWANYVKGSMIVFIVLSNLLSLVVLRTVRQAFLFKTSLAGRGPPVNNGRENGTSACTLNRSDNQMRSTLK